MRSARLLGVLFALTASSASAKEFRSSDVYPFDYPTVQGVVQADKLMRERSGGKLGITVLGFDDRDSENYTVAQVRNGSLDMARVNLGVLNSVAPPTVVPALPYLFRSKVHARRVLDGPIGDEILASLESQGLIGLCFYDGGPRHFYSSKRAVRTPDDVKGLRVRVQQADVWSGMIRMMGGEPVAVPTDRVYLALQTGTLDSSEHNWPTYVSLRHYHVARYFSLTEHSMAPAVLIFSKRVWDTLTKDEQAIIRSSAKDSVPLMRRLWDDYESAGRKTVEAAGGEVVSDVNKKAFADLLTPYYPPVTMDPALQSLIARVRAEGAD